MFVVVVVVMCVRAIGKNKTESSNVDTAWAGHDRLASLRHVQANITNMEGGNRTKASIEVLDCVQPTESKGGL